MAIFYRGAGISTYWHLNNPVERGFIARNPEMEPTTTRLMNHVARSTVNSPFISVTRSYGVAWHYAMSSSTRIPTSNKPAEPGPPYQHDGLPGFLVGIVDPGNIGNSHETYR